MARILLIVGGGIAAYKAAELVRAARKAGHEVTPVLTAGGAHFVTPMSLAALAESPVYTSLWDLKDETEMGHIQLSRARSFRSAPAARAGRWAGRYRSTDDELLRTVAAQRERREEKQAGKFALRFRAATCSL